MPEVPEGFLAVDEMLAKFSALPGMADRMARARRNRAERESARQGEHLTLATLRRRAGLSQKELADRINTKQPAISMYESGEREPTLPVIRALAEALDVSFDDLIPALSYE